MSLEYGNFVTEIKGEKKKYILYFIITTLINVILLYFAFIVKAFDNPSGNIYRYIIYFKYIFPLGLFIGMIFSLIYIFRNKILIYENCIIVKKDLSNKIIFYNDVANIQVLNGRKENIKYYALIDNNNKVLVNLNNTSYPDFDNKFKEITNRIQR